MQDKISIYGISYNNVTLDEAAQVCEELLAEDKNHIVVTPNAEIAYMAVKDKQLGEIINSADVTIADGIGVVYASKIYGTPVKAKVPGVELGIRVLENAAKSGRGVFFLGAKPGVAELAASKLSEKIPGINFVGIRDGYFKDDSEVIESINASGADILFVCLGAPKQEKWMAQHKDEINVRLMLGLGGSLDSYAGTVKRAPDIFIKLGLEWFYRLLKEPWRFGRMMALPKYIFAVIFDSLRKKGK
ncbi:MAG: WecB/TagA/CpsF family glycosyltransferase [Oscillospiraceae bacterium]|nr:WecB/TagA/CpsF family glycosyltransferase [Oscillospiraceae bacterium]